MLEVETASSIANTSETRLELTDPESPNNLRIAGVLHLFWSLSYPVASASVDHIGVRRKTINGAGLTRV